ncbi:MAG: UbiA family prenyltransferase [Candidatus Sulfotelmatobacter sp.]
MRPDTAAPASERQSTRLPQSYSLLPPLVVDLDGTLLKTDLLLESLFSLLRQAPLSLFALPFWLLRGRAHLKREVALRSRLDVALLPYRTVLLEQLSVEHEKGRSIVLATASDERLAQPVADHLKLFDSVLASDGRTNLSGERKRERLVSLFGERGFDYAGNVSSDVAVWSSARKAIVVNPKPRLLRHLAGVAEVQGVLKDRRPTLHEYLSGLRPQHWLKNLLVFVPVFAAHRFYEPALFGRALLAFAAFCCCASSGYLFNDLLDLSDDRRHPRKSLRPFASGRLPASYAFVMIPALIVLGCLLAATVSRPLLGVLLLYFAFSLTYSLYIKEVALLDVIVLAGLYTLRILAGAMAVAIWPSAWLLAFSMFLFLSLALVKRYDELVVMRSIEGGHARARSYEISDAELLASKGTASGYIAVLVLALYISSSTAKTLYRRPEFMWFLCPLLLYWVGHMWLVAHRGEMIDDPLVFALRDRTSRILILLMSCTALLAV